MPTPSAGVLQLSRLQFVGLIGIVTAAVAHKLDPDELESLRNVASNSPGCVIGTYGHYSAECPEFGCPATQAKLSTEHRSTFGLEFDDAITQLLSGEQLLPRHIEVVDA